MPDRARRPLRRALLWVLLALQSLLALLLLAYLLRWPLFEAFGRAPVERLLREALGGEVHLGELGGSVLTGVTVRGLSLESPGILRRVEALDVRLELDPLALARGDLAGIAQVRVHARRLALDLTAPRSPSEPVPEPTTQSGPPDLAAFAAALPAGASIAVDDLHVQGAHGEVRGPARIDLLPGTNAARRLRLRSRGLAVDVALATDGSLRVEASAGDATALARLFAPVPPLAGGEASVRAELALAPSFAASVEARVDGLSVEGRAVRRCEVAARVTTAGLTSLVCDLDGPGATLRAAGASMDFARVLPSLRGDFALEVRDLSPWRASLPERVRDLLPLTGSIEARADGGVLHVADGDLRASGARLRLFAGSVRFDGEPEMSSPARAELTVLDAARLPLPASLRVRPTGGAVALRVAPQAGAFAILTELDVPLVDVESASTASVRGRVSALVRTDGSLTAEPTLEATGPALGAFEAGIRVRGAAQWQNGIARVDGLELELVGAAALRGRAVVPTGELAAVLAGLELDLGLAADEAQRARLEAILGVAATGDVRMQNGTLRLDGLRAFAKGRSFDLGGEVRIGAPGAELADVRVQDDLGNDVVLTGTLPLPTSGLEAMLRAASIDAIATAETLLPYAANASPPPATAATARARIAWRGADPTPLRVELRATAAGIASGSRSLDGACDLVLEGDATSTRLASMRVRIGEVVTNGTGSLGLGPIALALAPATLVDAPLTFAWSLPETDVSLLPVELLGFAQWSGRLGVDVAVAGALAKPEPRATVTLRDGGMLTTSGQRLDDLEVQLDVVPDAVRITRFSATRGAGPMHVAGAFTTPGPLWDRWREGQIDLAITGADVLLHRRAGVKVRTDLDVKVSGPVREMVVAGEVALHDSVMLTRIPLLEWQRTGGRAATAGIAIPGLDLGPDVGARIDVRVITKEPFAIRNNVLDGKLDVALAVRGTLANPVLEGTVSAPDARVLLPGIRLRATTMLVEWKRESPRFPTLTVAAQGRRHGFDVNVVVRGRYDRPEILLSSTPPLPPEELIVLVTTGARPESLRGSAGVGTVLGAYLAQELADWIFGSESTEAKESFVDRFSIETGTELSRGGTQSIVVEFRVLDSVYLRGERDVYEDLNMGVVYRLRFR